jgi:predicted RNA-binding protein YlqC (UPF0109 family)
MLEEEQSRPSDEMLAEQTVGEGTLTEPPATDEAEEAIDAYEDIGEVEGEAEMRDMIGYIARVLVDAPEAVQVRSQWSDGRLNINLKVADADKGKVIGRRGRVVHAMQSLLRVAATKSNMRAGIDVE